MPVCSTCEDTHLMPLGEDRQVMCTRCPVPCRKCATDNGVGAYCSTTPCGCGCHKNKGASSVGRSDADATIEALNAQLDEAHRDTASLLLWKQSIMVRDRALNEGIAIIVADLGSMKESTADQARITRMIDDIDSALVDAGFNAGTVVERVGRVIKLVGELKRERDDFAGVAEDARAALAVEQGNVLVLRSMAEHAETALSSWLCVHHDPGAFEHTGIEDNGACEACAREAIGKHVADALSSTTGDDEARAADSIARAEVEHERDRLRAEVEDLQARVVDREKKRDDALATIARIQDATTKSVERVTAEIRADNVRHLETIRSLQASAWCRKHDVACEDITGCDCASCAALDASREYEQAQHPDDVAVSAFAEAMRAKLAKKRTDGRGGWQDKTQCTAEMLSTMLRDHAEKGDPVDVGNLAMMLHQRGERIAWSGMGAAPNEAKEADDSVIIGGDEHLDLHFGSDPLRGHYEQIEKEVQRRLANGTPQSSMAIGRGTDEHGMPFARLFVDGVAVAHFGVTLKVEGGDVPR